MGGASRNEKKRRQEAAAAAAGRRRHPGAAEEAPRTGRRSSWPPCWRSRVVAGLAVWSRCATPAATVTPTYTASRSGAVVTVGSGPVMVDVYEDFLCPICERFEKRYGTDLTTALNANQITVRYHSIAILDERTTPTGYSTRAANAALCSVTAGIFPAYHKQLFDSQPAEGSAGLTDDQLIAVRHGPGARRATSPAASTAATNATAVTAETEKAVADAGAADRRRVRHPDRGARRQEDRPQRLRLAAGRHRRVAAASPADGPRCGRVPSCGARGCGAAGSAFDWQSKGQGFESPQLHSYFVAGLILLLQVTGLRRI